jgi:hypothetical protein
LEYLMLGWLTKGAVGLFTEPLLKAYEMSLSAENDADKRSAEAHMKRLESARDIALAESQDRWSAVRIGRVLIVVPFGLWWAGVLLVSIVNANFGWSLVIQDLPPRIWDLAYWLIPAIILGDVGQSATRILRK